MLNKPFAARSVTTVVALCALLALGACGKKVDTIVLPATPANTAPSVTTPMPDTATGTMGSSSAPTSMMGDPTMPASAASAAK